MLSGFQAETIAYWVTDLGYVCTDKRCVRAAHKAVSYASLTATCRYTLETEADEAHEDICCELCGATLAEYTRLAMRDAWHLMPGAALMHNQATVLAMRMVRNGGFTAYARCSDDGRRTYGRGQDKGERYIVGGYAPDVTMLDNVTIQRMALEIQAYARSIYNIALLDGQPAPVLIGGWHDADAGTYVLDSVRAFDDLGVALAAGVANHQKAVWDRTLQEEIAVPYAEGWTGEPALVAALEELAADMAAESEVL